MASTGSRPWVPTFLILFLFLQGLCPWGNEEYNICPFNCTRTCETLGNPMDCTMDCLLPGECQCKNGYVRNSLMACVLPIDCPIRSCPGANEEYKECPSKCPPTCDNWNKPISCTDEYHFPGKCQCKNGYVRNNEGACVLPNECPKKSCPGDNEEFMECPSNCPPTCDNWNKPIFCTDVCRLPGECQCKIGYVRNNEGDCVLPSDCPEKSCPGANEEYKECPSNCPPTCDNWNKPISCTEECHLPGKCQCKDGYVRNSKGDCVRPKECPIILVDKGNHFKSSLGTTWNDRMKDALVSITAKIPPKEGIPVGQMISQLLKVFWPSTGVDIWHLIKKQVADLLDVKTLESELQERNAEIINLQKTMVKYEKAQIRGKGSLMSSMIHASNELFIKLSLSKNSVQLIPLLVTHSSQHLLILKERLLHGKEMYNEDNSKVWRKDLMDHISAYKDHINTIYSKWVTWRKSKITLELGVHKPVTTVSPLFRYLPYGNVHDQITGKTVKYEYSALMGPNNESFFREICEAVKKNMFDIQNGALLQILVPTFYLDNFIPGKEDNPSVIPSSISIASFGPISPSVHTIRSERYSLHKPGNDNSGNGEVTSINVREWNMIDGFQVNYNTHKGSFVGNSEGGLLHEVQLNNRRAKSLRFCCNNCNMVEVTIGFSNGESTGRLGNHGGWMVDCADTGGIDTYGLYNVRLSGGGCASGLYQIELEYKAYPTKPSQIDSRNLHVVDFGKLKYSSVTEEGNIHCCCGK